MSATAERLIHWDPVSSNLVGETFGSYQVIRAIAAGGMGEVYLAEHVMMSKRAAVKVLRPELSHDSDLLMRFFNEAESAGIIEHPSIVDIYDCGFHESGLAYLIMEYLEGEDLRSRIARVEVLGEAEALTIVAEVASTLVAAHARGILHRDIKPSNVFLTKDSLASRGERARLLDFGIAKLVSESGNDELTAAGDVLGSPPYMSPEQCLDSREVDARSDVYSLGCLLYECLRGRPPFRCTGLAEYRVAHLEEAPARLADVAPAVSPAVDALVMRALSKSPDERFQSMSNFLAAIERAAETATIIDGSDAAPMRARPTTRLPVALLVAGLIVAAALAAFALRPAPAAQTTMPVDGPGPTRGTHADREVRAGPPADAGAADRADVDAGARQDTPIAAPQGNGAIPVAEKRSSSPRPKQTEKRKPSTKMRDNGKRVAPMVEDSTVDPF